MMTTGMGKQQLREIVRAKMNVIEKERTYFYRFRALLAQLDYDAYRLVMKEFTPEVREASDEEFLEMLDDLSDREQRDMEFLEKYRGWHR